MLVLTVLDYDVQRVCSFRIKDKFVHGLKNWYCPEVTLRLTSCMAFLTREAFGHD